MTWECSEKGMSILRVTLVAFASRSARISSLAFCTADGLPMTFTWGSVGRERERSRNIKGNKGKKRTMIGCREKGRDHSKN